MSQTHSNAHHSSQAINLESDIEPTIQDKLIELDNIEIGKSFISETSNLDKMSQVNNCENCLKQIYSFRIQNCEQFDSYYLKWNDKLNPVMDILLDFKQAHHCVTNVSNKNPIEEPLNESVINLDTNKSIQDEYQTKFQEEQHKVDRSASEQSSALQVTEELKEKNKCSFFYLWRMKLQHSLKTTQISGEEVLTTEREGIQFEDGHEIQKNREDVENNVNKIVRGMESFVFSLSKDTTFSSFQNIKIQLITSMNLSVDFLLKMHITFDLECGEFYHLRVFPLGMVDSEGNQAKILNIPQEGQDIIAFISSDLSTQTRSSIHESPPTTDIIDAHNQTIQNETHPQQLNIDKTQNNNSVNEQFFHEGDKIDVPISITQSQQSNENTFFPSSSVEFSNNFQNNKSSIHDGNTEALIIKNTKIVNSTDIMNMDGQSTIQEEFESRLRTLQERYESRLKEEQQKQDTKQKVVEKFNEKRITSLRAKLKEITEEKEKFQKLYNILQEKSATRHSEMSGTNFSVLEDKIAELEAKLLKKDEQHKIQISMMRDSWMKLRKNIRVNSVPAANKFDSDLGIVEESLHTTPTPISLGKPHAIEQSIQTDLTPANTYIGQISEVTTDSTKGNDESTSQLENKIKNLNEEKSKFEQEVVQSKAFLQQQASIILNAKNELQADRTAFGLKVKKLSDLEEKLKQREELIEKRSEELATALKAIQDGHDSVHMQFQTLESKKLEFQQACYEKELSIQRYKISIEERGKNIERLYAEAEQYKLIFEEKFRILEQEYHEKMERIANREKALLAQKEELMAQRSQLEYFESKHGDLDKRMSNINKKLMEMQKLEEKYVQDKLNFRLREKDITRKEISLFIQEIVSKIELKYCQQFHEQLLRFEDALCRREESLNEVFHSERSNYVDSSPHRILEQKSTICSPQTPTSNISQNLHSPIYEEHLEQPTSPYTDRNSTMNSYSARTDENQSYSSQTFMMSATPKQPKSTNTSMEVPHDFLGSLRFTYKKLHSRNRQHTDLNRTTPNRIQMNSSISKGQITSAPMIASKSNASFTPPLKLSQLPLSNRSPSQIISPLTPPIPQPQDLYQEYPFTSHYITQPVQSSYHGTPLQEQTRNSQNTRLQESPQNMQSILDGENIHQTLQEKECYTSRYFDFYSNPSNRQENYLQRNPFPLPSERTSHILNEPINASLISPKLSRVSQAYEHPLYINQQNASSSKFQQALQNSSSKQFNGSMNSNRRGREHVSDLEYRLLEMGKELRLLNEEWKNEM